MPDRRFLLALVLLAGCYDGHVVPSGPDAAMDASHPDADLDGALGDAGCVEGSTCDDGDPCTVDDRCVSGTCAGVPLACESPPGLCFTAVGLCVDGECVYEPADGSSCDDGDPCTSADRCTDGVCAGEPLACDAPPPPVCLDETTLRTFVAPGVCGAGACTYAPRDRPCPDGCVDGACRCVDRPWELAIVPDVPPQIGSVDSRGIAVDASGTVHITFMLQSNGSPIRQELWYAQRPLGGAWTLEPVIPWVRRHPLQVDGAGGVHLFDVMSSTTTARHGYRPPSGGWTTTHHTAPPSSAFAPLHFSFMSIDDAGVLHAVLRSYLRTAYATRAPGGAWNIEEEWDRPPSAALRGAAFDRGTLSLIHVDDNRIEGDPARYTIRHRLRSSASTWAEYPIDSVPRVSQPQLIEGQSSLHLLYTIQDADDRHATPEVRHAWWSPGASAWSTETVTGLGEHEGLFSAAVDALERVHLVYRVRGPVPATHVGYALRSPSGTWSAHPIELPRLDYISFGPNPVGLAVDPDGGAHIAYSRIGETLVYGHRRDCP